MTDTTPTTTAPSSAERPALTAGSLNNAVTLIMGVTGSGKSSLLATLMEWVWENYHRVTLYYLADGGGFPTQVQALIRKGIGRLWVLRSRSGAQLGPETMHYASLGWWPRKIDPATGIADPAVELVPPITEKITVTCPSGHLVGTFSHAAVFTPRPCPTCKVHTSFQNAKVDRVATRTKGFENVGAVMFDGISSMCSWNLDDLSKRDLGGEGSNLGGVVVSGNMRFGANNRAQIGQTQKRAEALILNSIGIPGLVVPPAWTALTQEGTDEGNLAIRGPLIAGQAVTAVAPQWVGNCFEPQVVEKDGKKFRRLWLQEFMEGPVRHLCKVRAYPHLMPEYLEDEDSPEKKDQVFVNFNLGYVHKLFEDAVKMTEADYDRRYPDAPGLGATPAEYGEETTLQPAPPAPAGAPATVPGRAPGGVPGRRPGPAVSAPPSVPASAPAPAPVPAPVPAPTAPSTPQVAQPVKTAPAPAPAKPAQTSAPAGPRRPGPAAPPAPRPAPQVKPAQATQAATGPQPQAPAAPRGPARGPAAAPPGRRPTS